MSEPSLPTSPITVEQLAAIRAQLPAVTATTYLNAGTLGPLPRRTIEVLEQELRLDATRRQYTDLWPRLGELQTAARAALTTLTGVTPEQVSLMHTTHAAINTCLWGLELGAGDSIVTTDEEHMGVLVPLRHVTERRGAQLRLAPWRSTPEAFVEEVLRVVDARTRAVVISHVSWVSGRIAPLRQLRAALPAHCRIIVDGAQAAGVLAVHPDDGWDAYTVSGQKWPCAPNGTGGLALVDPEAWLPTFGHGLQVEDYTAPLTSPLVRDGRRFETSQESMAPLAGLAASVGWLVEEVGIARAHAHARALNARARAQLATHIPAESLHGTDHLLCIDVAPGTADAVTSTLAARDIGIRSLGSDRIRLSFGCWTSPDEVDEAVAAVLDSINS